MLTLTSREQRRGYAIPLRINRYHVNIAINNQLTVTKIKQTFTNPNDFEIDAIYIFPVSGDVAISNFAFSVDGQPLIGSLLSYDESRHVYRSSVREGRNLGIMDHFGKRAFVADVQRIPANGVRNIEFEYSEIVQVKNDLVKYTYPLSLAKGADSPIDELVVKMDIESDSEIRAIYSPSHEIEINREDDRHVCISYTGNNIDADDDFECNYSVSDESFGMTLLTHRADENEDGYFMLLISPKYEVKKTDVIEKDFIFVLDHSGSMAGKKVRQAKEALRYCVNNLNDGDRFNLILFNSDITSLADRLNSREEWIGGGRGSYFAAMSHELIDIKSGREKALAFIEDIEGSAMTNINDALLKALSEKPDPNRPRIIVFLTDGCPTVGVTNDSQILKNVGQVNKDQSRIFVFGVGYDLNVRLLDKLAADNGGTRNYVEPDEDIEAAVSSLFSKMNEPVLVDVEINFGQIQTQDLSPSNFPDLFRGEQLALLGRYRSHGDTALKLRGKINGEGQEFSKTVHFTEIESDNNFLPTVWAQRRIIDLVDQAALNGYSEELRKEIERISSEYDVITPHTSFERATDGSYRRQYVDRIDNAYDPRRSREDVIKGIKEIEYGKSTRVSPHHDDIKHIGRKTFHRFDGLWVDTRYDDKSDRKKIEIGSDEYFDLANESNELARCLKLDHHMIICHNGVNYEITPRSS